MELRRAGLTLAISFLAACGGTFTQQGEPAGGSAGVGSSAGTTGEGGGPGGTTSKGGTGSAGYGATGGYGNAAGTSYAGYGASGGDIGGWSGTGGDIGGGGASGGDAGAGGCGPTTSPMGPYPVKFVFSTNTPVYIKEDCSLNYDILSCSSGSNPIMRDAFCVADCSDTSVGCVACGACFSGAKEVSPDAPVDDTWDGRIYQYGMLPSGCSCATGYNAAPGTYTLVISEFFSESDAMNNANPYVRRIPFQLPAPNGVVSVDLGVYYL